MWTMKQIVCLFSNQSELEPSRVAHKRESRHMSAQKNPICAHWKMDYFQLKPKRLRCGGKRDEQLRRYRVDEMSHTTAAITNPRTDTNNKKEQRVKRDGETH